MASDDASYMLRYKVRPALASCPHPPPRPLLSPPLSPPTLSVSRAPRPRKPHKTQIRLGDINGVRNILKAGVADPCVAGPTLQQWTPLHCAAWGTIQTKNDKDIVEALLLWGGKNKKDAEMKAAVWYAATAV